MWMQVAGAPYNTSTTTINEPSNHHHHHHHHQVVNLDGGRKLRPLIPRPLSTSSSSSSSSSHSCSFDLYTAAVEPSGLSNNKKNCKEESNGGGCATSLSSSRWNPTAEQVRTLEELYRRGTRTPSTDQIQRITAQLRRFGNIEGKNVFYWFQNHKARERQKRRRHHLQSQAPNPNPVLPTKDLITPGKLGFDAQQEQQPRSHFAASQYSCSYADGATFKTRRLLAADQTTTRRETTNSELLYEDQDSAPLLQLFPLTTQVNAGQQHPQHEEDEDEDAPKEAETDNNVHFFEFLPSKIN